MLKNVIGDVVRVDYLTFEVGSEVDITTYLEDKGYKVSELTRDEFVRLVDDEYYQWSDSKHQYWSRSKEEEVDWDMLEGYEGASGMNRVMRSYRKVSVNNDQGYEAGFLLELCGNHPKSKITLRSDMINSLGYQNIKKLLYDLNDVSTVSRIDLAKDLYFKDEEDLSITFSNVSMDLHKDPYKGYFGNKNEDNPIEYKGLLSDDHPTYYIGDEDDPVNIRVYNPIKHGLSVRSQMYKKLSSYYKLSMVPDIKNIFDTFESSMGVYIDDFMNQFNILRFDYTLKGEVAEHVVNYIISSDGDEEEVINHLIDSVTDDFLKV